VSVAAAQSASRIELLQVAPPGAEPFVLAAESAGDRRFVPYVRSHAIWEPAETLALLRMVTQAMRVIDVGAHVGYYSVLLSRRIGEGGRLDAFEPEPTNRRLLNANLLLNDCRNVAVHGAGVCEASGRSRLYLCADNLGDHRLDPVPGRDSVEVETVSLDEALRDSSVDLIKIDTQGAEPRVLAGMRKTVRANRARLACMVEFAPGLLERGGVGVAAFADQLASMQASAYHIVLRGRSVTLHALSPLAAGLAEVAAGLRLRGEEDASADLLVFFSRDAEAAWLARFRQ
jgi:FkbM family methyltransferase